MQVLISQSSYDNLRQYMYSPKEILVKLEGSFDRNIFYLTESMILEVGDFDTISLDSNGLLFQESINFPNFIGFFHTHPNKGSLGNSLLSSSDINFFLKISKIWQSKKIGPFPILLGVGSSLSQDIGVLYDIKFYILDESDLPQEITMHIIS